MISKLPFTLEALGAAYASGATPEAVIAEAFRRLEAVGDPGIFIHLDRETALAEARALGKPDGRPLWGIPFAVKDNIDVRGMPTTAACPDFAYDAGEDAFVVRRLREAGAICIGKTNLDQFATGLVGVRSPYKPPLNALDPAIVPGGSSSGSGVAVAHGIVAFSLGTDTAGSGRVPAALNSIVGLKPTLGMLSSTGVVPACRTLDTISIFAQTVADAWSVLQCATAYDAADAYSRTVETGQISTLPPGFKVAIPDAASLVTFGDAAQKQHFSETVDRLRASGATVNEIDLSPFYEVARLLYDGPWVAERTAAIAERIAQAPETLHPTTRAIIGAGLDMTAVDAFRGQYRLKELRRTCEAVLAKFDMLCIPTVPTFVRVEEIARDPIGPNSQLGTYTNFVNLLDLCGIAVPTGERSDGKPGSLTILASSGRDALAASLAAVIETGRMGATDWERPAFTPKAAALQPDEIAVAVCGAHMSGLPLNHELTSRGARFVRASLTAPEYRFYALSGGPPARPGLVRDPGPQASSIAVEVWALPMAAFGRFMAGIPSPLCIGSMSLADGTAVKGFLCEAEATATATEITSLGSWRRFVALQAGKSNCQVSTSGTVARRSSTSIDTL